MSVTTTETTSATDIRAFTVEFPQEAISDLRRRIAATRWPSKELVEDRSQGVQLTVAEALTRYWLAGSSWRISLLNWQVVLASVPRRRVVSALRHSATERRRSPLLPHGPGAQPRGLDRNHRLRGQHVRLSAHHSRRTRGISTALVAAARFLTRTAWDSASATMPFEIDPPAPTYFFDCGIVVRGLVSVWRATADGEFLDVAAALGQSMVRDFASADGSFHPVLSLPDKRPLEPEPGAGRGLRDAISSRPPWPGGTCSRPPPMSISANPMSACWSIPWAPAAASCPAMPSAPRSWTACTPSSTSWKACCRSAQEPRVAAAIREGIGRAAHHLREIAPEFERSDVYAQLLRMRLYADRAGALPLDRAAAQFEAERLARFQASAIGGGFYFGRKAGAWLPYVNPVSSAFALQALELWDECRNGEARVCRHLLI